MKLFEFIHTRSARLASYGLLLVALLLVLVVWPAVHELGWARTWVLHVFFVVMIFACVAAAVDRTRVLAGLFTIVLVLEIVSWILLSGEEPLLASAQHVLRGLVLGLTALLLLRDVAKSRSVNADAILGAICVYFLLGMLWTEAYIVVDIHDANAFLSVTEAGQPRLDPHVTLPYFSMITLTTLGYGDVTPVNPLARSLAALEAAVGQLYIAIIIARLVALGISARVAEGKAAADAQ